MSTKLGGCGLHRCDACGRGYMWGCGHSDAQERNARRHNRTHKHAERRCRCFGHDHCDPKTCKLAGIQIPGYAPFYQHTGDPEEAEL